MAVSRKPPAVSHAVVSSDEPRSDAKLGRCKIAILTYIVTFEIQSRFCRLGTFRCLVAVVPLLFLVVWNPLFYPRSSSRNVSNAVALPLLQKIHFLCARALQSHEANLSHLKARCSTMIKYRFFLLIARGVK